MSAFSAKNYILKNGRNLPIERCFIGTSSDEFGIDQCMIIRKQPSGYFSIALFLVDTFCLGVKDVIYNCNLTTFDIQEMISRILQSSTIKDVTPAEFHNHIYASIDYAESFGLMPCKDFKYAEYLLNPDLIDDGIEDVELGKDGKPLYIAGPFDPVKNILAALNRTIGEGNYDYILPVDEL
ncbi:MAG: hypothetical protein A2W85_07590 [Bacteroidetes bacterium GWF2_41_31]|nr:MAG: hypothetical protein A2W85_07590 [Bacteroidetes bacterium GWF2_41_31]